MKWRIVATISYTENITRNWQVLAVAKFKIKLHILPVDVRPFHGPEIWGGAFGL